MALKHAVTIGVPATSKKSAIARKSNHTRVKVPHIPLDMPGRYSTGNVMAVTGWSHSTLYNRINEGKFPPPNKSGSMNYWDTHVVRAALGL
ncbi:MAG TPA: AlpA family phage regulatory protein [Sideroxyarcus sp.]|nr:AlpA family phage regulatory protein [Sideroxyarcus sp.]